MKNKQLVIICMTFLTIGYVETLLADQQQVSHVNAEEFMKGGTFCFLEIAEADGRRGGYVHCDGNSSLRGSGLSFFAVSKSHA